MSKDPGDASPRTVLVTGAAGLIGSEACGRLAENGHGVVALVHRSRHLVRNDGRVLEPQAWSSGRPEPGTIRVVAGDVREPGLGLAPAAAADLAGSVDLILHCAAATGFAAPADLQRDINVGGTRNVLAVAASAPRPVGLVHVSTAYVCGERSGPVGEDAMPPGTRHANGYEASKAEAEALVRGSGLGWAIARPSIVVGRSGTGEIGRFENIYGFLKLIVSGRISVLPSTPGASLDLVPIDHVVDGLVDLVERFREARGRTFHLVSGDPTPLATLVSLDYPGFRVPRLVPPAELDPDALRPGEAVLHDAVTSLYAAYLRRDPRFVAENLRALSGRACPPTGPGFLRRVINYAAEAGYLRRRLT